jgi:hypothetical protein
LRVILLKDGADAELKNSFGVQRRNNNGN